MFAGVEGGFDTDEKKYEVEEINSVVVLPDWTEITLPNPDLPGEVSSIDLSYCCWLL